MQAQKSTGEILSILGLLYDAATDIDKWPAFLESIAGFLDGFGANINYYDVHHRKLNFVSYSGLDKAEEYIPLFLQYIPDDPRHPGRSNKALYQKPDPEWKEGKPFHDRMCATEEEIHSSLMYKKVLLPLNIEYTMMAAMGVNTDEQVVLGIFRGPDSEPWNDQDCALLSHFVPHIQRAITIHKRLCQLDFERRSALEVLDRINMGLILLDEHTQILYANSHARGILDGKDGISQNGASLQLEHAVLAARLEDTVREVIESTRECSTPAGKCLSLARPSGKRDYSLLISPVWGNLMRIRSNALHTPVAAVFISDPESIKRMQVDLLRQLYGLTGTEARIVEGMVNGGNVRDLSAIHHVQENTIRQHLKNIYKKTDSGTQAALIRKIMTSPVWLGSQVFSKKYS